MVTIGESLSHYRIVEELGHGGMGVVYRARDEHLPRDVALKVLPAGLFSDETARSRFRREAQTLSQLNHPNIATVFDFDRDNGVDFLAMEFVEGETLAAKVAAGPLPEKEVIALGTQIAEALEDAHEHGIIHRDLKPGNVMVTSKGRAKVLDFGLAKLTGLGTKGSGPGVDAATASLAETQAGAIMGTIPYMAPEQLQGKPADTRTDVYALGAVLYEMATGQRPFAEKQSAPLIASILTEAPQPPRQLNPQISPELQAVIQKALERNPEQRYQSAKEILENLRQVGTGLVPAPHERGRPQEAPLRKVAAGAGALVVVLAVLMAFNVAGLRNWVMRSVGAIHESPLQIRSLAVLPLDNLSGDPQQEYFADGMTEELIATLGKLSALHVISRTSVMRYKKTDKPLPQIAKELNVDAVVEGSVLRAGDRVRITAQLIEASTDQHLWAETYDRDLRDVLSLQSDVARAIAEEIKVKVTPGEQARLASGRRVNPEAHEAYLKGRFYWNKRTPEGLTKSLDYFQQAIEKDPNYAAAYAGLADSYGMLADNGFSPPEECYPKARAAALKALEMDDTLAEAHTSLAQILESYDWDWSGSTKEIRRAIELNPGYANAHHLYALFLSGFGRPVEAIAEIKKARELDPLSIRINANVGLVFYMGREYDQALEELRKALELDPNDVASHVYLGLVYSHKGMHEEAITACRRARDLSVGKDQTSNLVLAYVYAVAGRRGEALRILDEIKKSSERSYVPPVAVAMTYVGLGDKQEALAWLEKAFAEHATALDTLKVDPNFDPLRSDPRFQDLLRRMNFPP